MSNELQQVNEESIALTAKIFHLIAIARQGTKFLASAIIDPISIEDYKKITLQEIHEKLAIKEKKYVMEYMLVSNALSEMIDGVYQGKEPIVRNMLTCCFK